MGLLRQLPTLSTTTTTKIFDCRGLWVIYYLLNILNKGEVMEEFGLMITDQQSPLEIGLRFKVNKSF